MDDAGRSTPSGPPVQSLDGIPLPGENSFFVKRFRGCVVAFILVVRTLVVR